MKPATLQINKAHYPVTVLGPGRRLGIWLQGCTIRCRGCVSQDTWERDAARAMKVADLLDWCRKTAKDGLDGVTISGGEPFDQAQGLATLLKGLRRWRRQAGMDFDLLCYSGYPLATLQQRHAELLGLLDAVIPEPYADGLPLGNVWRGSANQALVPLSELGRQRYAAYLDAPSASLGKRMQLAVEGQRIWLIGIPERDEMAQLEALCRSRGLTLDQVSWRR